MTATKTMNRKTAKLNSVIGYFEGDKPITLEAFEELFIEVRQLRKANKALLRKLEKYENGYLEGDDL